MNKKITSDEARAAIAVIKEYCQQHNCASCQFGWQENDGTYSCFTEDRFGEAKMPAEWVVYRGEAK